MPWTGDVREAGELPFGVLLRAGQHERSLDTVAREPPRMLDDDADAAGELEVVDDERDAQGYCRRSASCRSAHVMWSS